MKNYNPQQLRQSLCSQRMKLNKQHIKTHSKKIFNHLISLPQYQSANKVAVYWAHNGEVDTQEIIQHSWHQGKHCYLPRILPQFKMRFSDYGPDTKLVINKYGMKEPQQNKQITPEQLDIVLTPLVAFDHHGHRLGMGSGYYDRHFEFTSKAPASKPFLIGLAYSFQEISLIHPNPWDVNLDCIITEQRILIVR